VLTFLLSVVRTGVPYVWGAVAAWLAGHGLFADAVATVSDPAWLAAVVVAALAVVSTAVYAVVRLVEIHLPALLVRFLPPDVAGAVVRLVTLVLLGSQAQPTYTAPPAR
jgi:hypothetical protein